MENLLTAYQQLNQRRKVVEEEKEWFWYEKAW